MMPYRTIPPTAAPLTIIDLWYGVLGLISPQKAIEKFERDIKVQFSVEHVFPVSSGKSALLLALEGLVLLSSRQEVIIPAYTCFSVPSAIAKAGLKVRLCDVDPVTFDFDLKQLSTLISEKTLCVIPNHLFGIPSAMDVIVDLARRNGAFVVEDVAQALGGASGNRRIGTMGDVAIFSFGRGKNVTCGSGGLILTNSQNFADAIRRHTGNLAEPGLRESIAEFVGAALMMLFIHPLAYWIPANLPFLKLGQTYYYEDFSVKTMSGMKAGLLRRWEIRLRESNHARTVAGHDFARLLDASRIEDIPYLRFPLLMENRAMRDAVLRRSLEEGLGISQLYPTPIHQIPQIKEQFKGQSYPAASHIAECLITLPTHPLVRSEDRERIIHILNAGFGVRIST